MMSSTTHIGTHRFAVRVISSFILAVSFAGTFTHGAVFTGAHRNLLLTRNVQGLEAIKELGAQLPEVAREHGLDSQRLARLLQLQRSLGVDRYGSLMFACSAPAVLEGAVPALNPDNRLDGAIVEALTVSSGSSTQTVAATEGDVFKLHSFPGASRVIYLDFDGHTTASTQWNKAFEGGAPIVSQPFDTDGNPTSFSTSEQALIRKVHQRVAEDFAPFAVNVTTEDPGIEALRRSSSSDKAYGIRVVISPTNWYKPAGGVAYIGSFNWGSDTPCYVFSKDLQNGEKYIAEACSHETGHTLGLYHDGRSGASATEYFSGHGSWAPIMGNSYSKSVTQWSSGEYASANNTQDDFTVMQTYGAPLIEDDHGNELAGASVLAGPNVTDGGTIETRSDVDVFRFQTGSGEILLNFTGLSPQPNIDLEVTLLDGGGKALQTSNPSGLSASISANVAAGTYYLQVKGVGTGDPATNGYSDYASVGDYAIVGTIVATTAAKQPPTAKITVNSTTGTIPLSVSFSSAASVDTDGTISSTHWNFGNGATSTAANPSYTYTVAGTYTATLTVTDNDGLSHSSSVVVTATAPANKAPIAAISATPTSGVAPLTSTFSSTGSSDPDGSIVSYSWDFGDGTTSTGANPSKIYHVAGNYVAKLTVTDNKGATATAQVTIEVSTVTAIAGNDTIIVDEFDGSGLLSRRMPETTIPGQSWVVETGHIGISEGYAGTNNTSRAVIDSGAADCTVQAAIQFGSSSTGLMLRSADYSNYLRLSFTPTGMSLNKVQNGATSTIGSKKVSYTAGQTYVVKAVLSGSSITVSVDGTVLGTYTNSFNQTATRHGLFSSGSGVRRWDNFSVTR